MHFRLFFYFMFDLDSLPSIASHLEQLCPACVCELTHIQIYWLWGRYTLRGQGNDPNSFLLVPAGCTAAIVSIRLYVMRHITELSFCCKIQRTDEKI